jgi:hypothetical protein
MQMRQLSNTDAAKLARLERLIKGEYISDYNIQTRRLKGGSSSSLSSSDSSDLITALESPQEIQSFIEKREKENRKKLAQLSRLIHPLN